MFPYILINEILYDLLNSSFEASTSATRSIKSRISSFKEPPPFSFRSSKASCALLMASLNSFSASYNRYEKIIHKVSLFII